MRIRNTFIIFLVSGFWHGANWTFIFWGFLNALFIMPSIVILVLEFSKVYKPLEGAYDLYSFKLLPVMGKLIAKDADSYQYLAESIRMHPDQETLKQMMLDAGFDSVDYHNMSAGIVALHKGVKF